MKAKSLHFSKHGTVQPIAAEIGRVFQCVCDQIPPAYPCEGEKVVFIGVDMSGKVPAPVDHFCRDLNESRTKNVAFYLINGQPSALEDLKAAMSEVGVAWAERFPSLSISFAAGVENNTFTSFFTGPYWYPIMSLTSPLFAFGKNKARYQAAIEAYNQERYQYEQKILEVFKEVNDAVTSYRSAREKVTLMGNLKDASRKYVELALFQYQNGYISYIDVLDAQRSYFNSEIDYSNSVRDEFLAIIDLYKALGGGWSVPSDEEAEASADTAKTASKKTGK